MTDEKKAEELVKNAVCVKICPTWKAHNENCDLFPKCHYVDSKIKFCRLGLTEGRKEQENKDKGFCESFCMKGGRIAELEKENEELKKDKEYLDKVNNKQTEVILKLNDQIEKMKCCGNCSNSLYGNRGENGRCEDCGNKDNWELAE